MSFSSFVYLVQPCWCVHTTLWNRALPCGTVLAWQGDVGQATAIVNCAEQCWPRNSCSLNTFEFNAFTNSASSSHRRPVQVDWIVIPPDLFWIKSISSYCRSHHISAVRCNHLVTCLVRGTKCHWKKWTACVHVHVPLCKLQSAAYCNGNIRLVVGAQAPSMEVWLQYVQVTILYYGYGLIRIHWHSYACKQLHIKHWLLLYRLQLIAMKSLYTIIIYN